jgi:phospholipase/lecithinase/hemolysin
LTVQSLYKMGARKMMVAGLPPLGCLPVQKSLRGAGSGGCVTEQNEAAERYNAALQKALSKLEADSPGAKIAYVDIYTPLKDMAENPKKYGEQCSSSDLLPSKKNLTLNNDGT